MATNANELSERELEILRLLATGASNKDIANQLYISTNTVKVHLRNIFSKINVGSRTEAALFAINHGIVEKVDGTTDLELSNLQDSELYQERESIVKPVRRNRSRIIIGISLTVIISAVVVSGWLIGTRILGNSSSEGETLNDPQRWSNLPAMPTARYGLAAAADQAFIYAVGGYSNQGATGVMERYSLVDARWETFAEKPTPVYEIQSAVIGGKIFVPGGRLDNSEVTNLLEIYEPQSDSWSQGKELPAPRSAYALVAFEGRLYLFGGWDGKNFVKTVYRYDPVEDQWDELTPLPSPRGYAGAVTASGRIIVVGGYDGKKVYEDNLVYQPNPANSEQPAWTALQAMPDPRYAMATTSIADFVLVVGGTNSRGDSLNSLEYFPLTDSWQAFQQLSPETMTKLAVVSLGVNVYILGGEIGGQPSNQALSYQAIYNLSIPVVK